MPWNIRTLATDDEVFHCLARLRGKRWHCRGQSSRHGNLRPSIDRDPRKDIPRVEKINLERKSINIFRASARFFPHQAEQEALVDDFRALAVLRHYGVPTRLLDWSRSPHVAAYFAVCGDDLYDGEIWTFDEAEYTKIPQWRESEKWLDEFTRAAFDIDSVSDFFVCMTYPFAFARESAQEGLYSVTSKLDCDHAERIEKHLNNLALHIRYVIPKTLKRAVRERLREDHGIWRGSLYPDSAGAAETAKQAVFP